MNAVMLTGTVETNPSNTKPGSDYGKFRLSVAGFGGKKKLLEIVGKMEKIGDIEVGDTVAIGGKVSGRENDRGYLNMSIFLDTLELVGGTDSGYNDTSRAHQKSASPRRPAGRYQQFDNEDAEPPY